MSNLFANMTTDGLEQTQDRLGGGYAARETDLYTGKIKAMYAGQAASGARSVSIIMDMEDGQEYRETFYITNKAGQNYFLNKSDPTKKVPLPGFTIVDDICLVTTGKPLAEQATEDKVINLYDPEQKKEMPKAVPMLTEVIGNEVTLGILKQLENKSEKVGNDYVPTAETREINVTDKVFHTESRRTVVEAKSGAEKAAFIDSWAERNKGQTRDKRTIKDGQAGQAGKPGAPKAAPTAAPAAGATPRKSLFNK